MNRNSLITLALWTVLVLSAGEWAAMAQSWQTAQLLNDPSEPAAKTARITASQFGGFHTIYFHNNPGRVQYRRYLDGYLGPIIVLENHAVIAVPDICETGNGDIHAVWEDWEDTNYVGWGKSVDGGASFSYSKLTPWGGAKYPLVAALGSSTGPDAVMSVGQSMSGYDRKLYYGVHNGTSWSPIRPMGSWFDSEYQMEGMCRSLKDGTVYRSYGVSIGGVVSVCYRRYNGLYWEPEVVVATPGFFARQGIAVNPAGQIMIMWEKDSRVWTRVFTPGAGWDTAVSQEDKSGYAALTAIPGSNDFYLIYNRDSKRIYGVRWSGGFWGTRELVSVGLPDAFMHACDVTAGPDGTIYSCFEYWGSGDCQQWFNIRPGGYGPMGTLAGTVRDQFGTGLSGVSVGSGPRCVVSGTGGDYTLRLPVGSQTVTADKDYHTGQTISGVQIEQDQTTIQDFTVTAAPPGPVSAFRVDPSNGLNRLYWTNPTSGNFQGTVVRVKTSGYPTGPADGELVCDRSDVPGSSASVIHSGLSTGVTYYYAAFAHDSEGHFSTGAEQTGTPRALVCAEVKQLTDGYAVDLSGKVVTGLFPNDGCFYIQEPDRSSGIRVVGSSAGLSLGDRVNVAGSVASVMMSGYACERSVAATSLTRVSSGVPPSPIAVNCFSVGGGAASLRVMGVQDASGKLGVGLNNIGQLVRISGKLTYRVANVFYVDDGSNILDISGRKGVMVICPDSSIPAVVGNTVCATGIVQGNVPTATGWSNNRRCIQIRDYTDLKVYTLAGTVSGTVRDASGSAIVGATVSTTSGGYATTTATNGSYTLSNVTPGPYTLVASKSGYLSQNVDSVSVLLMQTTTVDFSLATNSGTVSGVVTGGGSGLVGATVSTNTGGYTTTTTTGGAYTLAAVAPGTYSVTASRTGYVSATNVNVSVSVGNTTTSSFALAAQPGSITGYVRDSANAAIAGATISTTTGGYTTTSAANGSYTLSSLVPGSYSVTASRAGFASQTNSAAVNPGAATTSNFYLTPLPGAISGYVRDAANSPVSGATVRTSTGGYATTSAADGSFTLSSVAVGTYSVTASKTGYTSHAISNVTVASSQTTSVSFSISVAVEKVTNGDMEGGFFSTGWTSSCSGSTSKLPGPSASVWGWNNDASYPFNTYDSASTRHAGGHALGLAFCATAAAPGKVGIAFQSVNLGAANATATFSVWAYHTDSSCPSIMCWNPGAGQASPAAAYSAGRYQTVCTDSTGQRWLWVNRTMTVTADASGYVSIMVGGASVTGAAGGSQVFIDDVSVK